MIWARGLGFSFVDHPVFAGVDLDVPAGGLWAVVGPSGCGKTTLLRVLAGLLPNRAGSLELPEGEGRPAVGLVFQDPRLLPWMTVAENLRFALEAAGWPPEDRSSRVGAMLARVGLADVGDRRPAALSGGMAQRAALARALATEPRVLLLDEPFSAVDPLLRERLQEDLLGLLRGSGTTAILVTHDVGEALFLADRVLVMACAPGQPAGIVARFEVPLPRPRAANQRHDPRLLALGLEVRRALGATCAGP